MNFRFSLYSFFAILLAVIAQSCVNDYDDNCDGIPDGKVTFRFNLNLGEMGGISRADGIWNPSDPTEIGSSFDSRIKLNDNNAKWLHVMIINDDDQLLHLNLEEGFQFNAVEGGYDMTATLDFNELRDGWSAGVYRVMVLANFRERYDTSKKDVQINTYTTLSDLKKAINNLSFDWYKDDKTRNNSNVPCIPMWGMTTARFNFDGITTQTFSVQLLRAVAKVKIQLTDKLLEAGYKVKSCNVNHFVRKSYYMPSGWDLAKSTSDGTEYYDASFHAVTDSKSTLQDLTVSAPGVSGETDDDPSLVFYLPELDATKNGVSNVAITASVANEIGEIETCVMILDNIPDGSYNEGKYKNNRYNVNRNHLYKFTIDKDIKEGELSYKIECWNLVNSAIGWNPAPADWKFESTDNEAEYAYVAFPSYPTDNSDVIKNTTSFADYKFTLTAPEGAVWKAFLVENGVEYTAEDKFSRNADGKILYDNLANTPDGFFFGVGNEDSSNNKAVSTGIARSKPYNIKVGTRLSAVNYSGNQPDTVPGNPDFLLLNDAGNYWKNKGSVPTCYLVIKIALDGKNFSETLSINPAKDTGDFLPYTFAGDATRIEIRQLFPFYASKANRNEKKLMVGTHSTDDIFSANTWWGYPMGYNIPTD
ncbi:MAG: hypothetical protein K2M04_03320 [Muribaculaceae bacterium]|nr:hypothetical protein [Muribaculaceae bacterium]